MPLDPSIAMGFRLPQAEQPFDSMGKMLTLRNALRQNEQAEIERQRRIAFEQEVKALPENERTLENITKIASRHAPADKVFQYGQQSLDRQAQAKATQEAATARLQQAASIADRTFQLKIDSAKDAREKTFWQQQRDQKRLEFEAERVRQGAGRLFYDTGIDYRGNTPDPAVNAPQAPVAAPSGTPAPEGQMQYAAAMQQYGGRPAGSPSFTVETDPNSPQPILGAPQAPAPQGASFPQVPMSRPGQGVPGVRAQAEMPLFTGSPREIAAARNKWLAEKDKGVAPPKPPAGYRVTAEGNLEAIPGGPADTKVQGVLNQDTQSLRNTNSAMDRLADEAKAIKDHGGLSKATGLMGWVPGVGGIATIPGTDAANFKARLDTLKSQIAFGVLQEMRNNSKTGGALGSVSDKEQVLLQANLAALDRAQSPEEFKASLDRIVKYTKDAKDRLQDAYNLKHKDKKPAGGGVKFLGFE